MILLISDTHYFDTLPIDKTYDMRWVNPYINVAQMTIIRPFLCDAFMDELEIQVGTNSLTADNLLLLDTYIRPALCWLAHSLAYVSETARAESKGMRSNTDDTSVAVDPRIAEGVRKDRYNNGIAYLDLARKFLDKNKDLYPLWEVCDCDDNKDVTKTGQIYMGKAQHRRDGDPKRNYMLDY